MSSSLAYKKEYAFNAICPYYTMFPLEYPMRIIAKHKAQSPVVLDPFCGRGTTIYAARNAGLPAYGFDTSPIAAAIARAKLARAGLEDVIAHAEALLEHDADDVPSTPFFRRAFSRRTLREICSLREGLLRERRISGVSAILRAAMLGCLHGPMFTESPSYFSNQMPRTFSSKPDYSVRYWEERNLVAPDVSVIDVLRKKLKRISDLDSVSSGRPYNVKCADARRASGYSNIPKASLIITSPPYYGMRTYVQDQWLRMWFLGGPEDPHYEGDLQISHAGHEAFTDDLAMVWTNVAKSSSRDAHLYIRFGTISSVKSDARKLMREALAKSKRWRLVSVRGAKSAHSGKRQADLMGQESSAENEFDFHAVRA